MIKFKDEQGNITTPRMGDYVHIEDLGSEDKHNAVREAFGDAGCHLDDVFGMYNSSTRSTYLLWEKDDVGQVLLWGNKGRRRLTPIYQQQTLFEAAKDADDGTRFKVGSLVLEKTRHQCAEWSLTDDRGRHCMTYHLDVTDFEQLPPEPVKADKVPQHLIPDYNKAMKLIADLLRWPGAQIGKPGYVLSYIRNIDHSPIEADYTKHILPSSVTFETAEQCETAWKAERPEVFK